MFVGSQRSFSSPHRDPAFQPVAVVLWQSSHDSYGISWLVEPVAGARRVYIKHTEHRKQYRPCRMPGQRWTRTLVTIERQLADRLRLKILSATETAELAAAADQRDPVIARRRTLGRPSWLR